MGDGTIQVRWSHEVDDGDYSVEAIRISATPVAITELPYLTEPPRSITPLCAVVDGDNHILGGVFQGVTYAITVAAKNVNGWSAESSPVAVAPYPEVSFLQLPEPSVCAAWLPRAVPAL